MRGPVMRVDVPLDSAAEREQARQLLLDLLTSLGDRVGRLSIDPHGRREGLEDFELRASEELQRMVPARRRVTEPPLDPRDPHHVRLFVDWCLASDLSDVWLQDGAEIFATADGLWAALYLRGDDVALVAGLPSASYLTGSTTTTTAAAAADRPPSAGRPPSSTRRS